MMVEVRRPYHLLCHELYRQYILYAFSTGFLAILLSGREGKSAEYWDAKSVPRGVRSNSLLYVTLPRDKFVHATGARTGKTTRLSSS
jgi:hypothetical protein